MRGRAHCHRRLQANSPFLQARPRLAKTLPRAMGYFLMNYISELEMKGLRVGQKHIAEGPEGRLRVIRLFV